MPNLCYLMIAYDDVDIDPLGLAAVKRSPCWTALTFQTIYSLGILNEKSIELVTGNGFQH